MSETGIEMESDVDAAVALMTVRGTWDRPLWQATAAAIDRRLAEHPEALIVDLSGLDDRRALSATLWADAQRRAAELEPPVELALCIPPQLPLADRMQHLAVRPHLPVYARVRQARVAIAARLPHTERLVRMLPPEVDSPSLARNLVSDACLNWRLTDLLHPSRLVMSELVTNAVEHARTEMVVAVSRRGHGLHLSVADDLATLPELRKQARLRRNQPLDDRGRGLRLVSTVATAWGALPTRTGKVVWATLQPSDSDRAPRQRRARSRNDGPSATGLR
ncbi:MAG: ATP-binding protein [Actinoplanes sp.]